MRLPSIPPRLIELGIEIFIPILIGFIAIPFLKKLGIDIEKEILYTLATFWTIFIILERHKMEGKFNQISETVKDNFEMVKDNFNKTEDKLRKIEKRLNKMIEYAALYTENKQFLNYLEQLRKKEGNIGWIIAKFISKKLAADFRKLAINISPEDYSKFASKLYLECKDSIYLTFPYTPEEWFRLLKLEDVAKNISEGKEIKNFQIPEHVETLIKYNIPIKRRLIILPSWEALMGQEKLFDKFLELNKGIEHRFVLLSKIRENYGNIFNKFDFIKYDYTILDGKIVLQWERAILDEERTPLELIDMEKNQTYQKLYKFLNNSFKGGGSVFKNSEEVKNIIKNKKENLIRNIIRTRAFPHKLSYFGRGSFIWKEIVDDPNYKLGTREKDTLRKFMEVVIGEIKNDANRWNVLHIGPGTGEESEIIIKGLGAPLIENYILVDISPGLLLEAYSFIRRNFENLNVKSYVLDIETDRNYLKEINNNNNTNIGTLFFLVGNGAILSNPSVLDNIKNAMKDKDKLIITIESYSGARKKAILQQYELDEILKLFASGLSIIGINVVDDKNLRDYFEIEYNSKKSHLEVFFKFKEWYENNDNKPESLNELKNKNIDRIKVFSSYKPSDEQNLRSYLEKHGFHVEQIEQFQDEYCFGCICSKKSIKKNKRKRKKRR